LSRLFSELGGSAEISVLSLHQFETKQRIVYACQVEHLSGAGDGIRTHDVLLGKLAGGIIDSGGER